MKDYEYYEIFYKFERNINIVIMLVLLYCNNAIKLLIPFITKNYILFYLKNDKKQSKNIIVIFITSYL